MFWLCTFLVVALTPLTSCKQYRTDYEYNKLTDSFYKLHIERHYKRDAERICRGESAKLFVAEEPDIIQVHAMMKRYPDIGDYVFVAEDGKAHESAEEQPIIQMQEETTPFPWNKTCDVVSRHGDIESFDCFYPLPFVCKVEAKDARFDETCNVYGDDYHYISSVGSCYRVSDIVYTWNGAYAECQAEGAHLVILNSEAEHQAVWNLLQSAMILPTAETSWFFFAGFRANKPIDDKPRVFLTIFNQTLADAGYSEWSPNEPNNAKNSEYCGSIFKNDGKLNDLDCSHNYGFVCEKEKALNKEMST